MLATGGVILTSAGALMISRSLELVKPIEFTHMKIGTGDISSLDNARALTDLVASYMTINMSSIVRNENTIRIRGSFTNESFSSEVTIKEIGVFAKIGAEQSVLFGYVNDGQGEVIPPGNSGNVISRTRDLYIGVTSEAEAVITIDKSLVYPTIEDLEEGLNQKENKFNKNSGFNKTKSDATNLKDSETLATSMAVAKTMEKAEEALNSAGGKEPAFNKNTAFNKNFGTGQNEILEGSKLAEILGIEYGGVLNNTSTKVAGKGYYDTANKKIYKCTTNTSINYADAGYFIEVSNNDLLGKLQNLCTFAYVNENKALENIENFIKISNTKDDTRLQVKTSGWYKIDACCFFQDIGTTTTYINIYVNDITKGRMRSGTNISSGNISYSGVVYAKENDILKISNLSNGKEFSYVVHFIC